MLEAGEALKLNLAATYFRVYVQFVHGIERYVEDIHPSVDDDIDRSVDDIYSIISGGIDALRKCYNPK